MGSNAVCEVSVRPGAPAAVNIRSAVSSSDSMYSIALDPRSSEHQTGFFYSRGVTPHPEMPDALRGYGLLLDKPVLIIRAQLPQEEAWLMLDWDESLGQAEQVILSMGAEEADSLLASRLKSAAERALTIHRQFYR